MSRATLRWFGSFRPTTQELLNIEQFCQRKFNEIKTKYFRELGQAFGTIAKPLMSGLLVGDLVHLNLLEQRDLTVLVIQCFNV